MINVSPSVTVADGRWKWSRDLLADAWCGGEDCSKCMSVLGVVLTYSSVYIEMVQRSGCQSMKLSSGGRSGGRLL